MEGISDVVQISTLLIIITAVGFISLFIYLIIRQNRKTNERRQQLAASGFTAVDQPDAALLQRIVALHGRKGQHYRLRNVFRRPIPEGEIILYDLWDTGGDEDSSVTIGAMALIAPTLHLPQMVLMTRPNLPEQSNNLLVKAAEKLIEWTAGMGGMQRIPFPDQFNFDKRYTVMGKDEAEVRGFLDEARLIYLASLSRNYQIAFNADAFTLANEAPRFTAGTARRSEPDHETMLEDARLILRWME